MILEINLTDQLALAALERRSLELRELVLEISRWHPDLSVLPTPTVQDTRARAIAAGIVEVLAERRGQVAPVWTKLEGATEPFFLVAAAETMPRLRMMCEQDAPLPLKKRNLYAPANFLEVA
jgi:capsid protein